MLEHGSLLPESSVRGKSDGAFYASRERFRVLFSPAFLIGNLMVECLIYRAQAAQLVNQDLISAGTSHNSEWPFLKPQGERSKMKSRFCIIAIAVVTVLAAIGCSKKNANNSNNSNSTATTTENGNTETTSTETTGGETTETSNTGGSTRGKRGSTSTSRDSGTSSRSGNKGKSSGSDNSRASKNDNRTDRQVRNAADEAARRIRGILGGSRP